MFRGTRKSIVLPGDNLSQTLLLLAGGLFLGVVFLVFVGVVWLGFLRAFRVFRLRAGGPGSALGRFPEPPPRGRRRVRPSPCLPPPGGPRVACIHTCGV